MIELKACPMCGDRAALGTTKLQRIGNSGEYEHFTGHSVNCISCGVCNRGIAEGFKTPERAAEHWNTRVSGVPEGISRYMMDARIEGDVEMFGGPVCESIPSPTGEWVKWDDVKHLCARAQEQRTETFLGPCSCADNGKCKHNSEGPLCMQEGASVPPEALRSITVEFCGKPAAAPCAIEEQCQYGAARNQIIEECAKLAECAAPNDGRDHAECPFCSTAKEIRALKLETIPSPLARSIPIAEATVPMLDALNEPCKHCGKKPIDLLEFS